ncbi:hypothetical protein GTO89_06350 [Heliobacterium gestii]|uniref:Uncharacterized protein n=1 Tax=Heliomicrobium gestii TaxID=2699 RepID=A0A845L8X5_HELGE|nr:hypothetical protein [Heliomicrobium gestii]MBM7866009.1 hypothetical protein [Heliomicrobium gestii]MZP42658.1 hypothetical protein [Heliomicrobium gestii]
MIILEFWLGYNNFSERLQLPVNPPEFSVKVGQKNSVVDVTDVGELNLIGGRKLAQLTIQSHFPALWRPYCAYRNILQPWDAVGVIERWRNIGKPIRLVVTGVGLSFPCAIEDFEYGEKGGSRDIHYTLSLREYRLIRIQQVGESGRPDERSLITEMAINQGDSLLEVAHRVYGDCDEWKRLLTEFRPNIPSDDGKASSRDPDSIPDPFELDAGEWEVA